ncbi:LPXTG cell wall anchor domain-containing protein [Enterococcus sp. BWR-S5]|uniref:LPXTG cell wall anchor domain-containing protein n=1 Tax=Enterococcus sp. BWR-S5 TaxID=2787714 RepID=UPI0019214BDA|nr:LPXTG cell wall anchor domain-containing protein [Enterococcus sp. BWR-S5]MBL1225822.1 LPXTG cell wall anchor domain-containing protein [Enterococcus sp. BWR-S5]
MRKNKLVLSLLVVLSLLSLTPLTAFATSEKDSEKSTSVQTNGAITFESEATIDSTTPITTEPTTTPTEKPPGGTTKPGGTYPSTGEIVKKGLTFGGAGIVALALILFFWKRKKDEEHEEGDVH